MDSKKLSALMALALCVTAFAACGKDDDQTETQVPSPPPSSMVGSAEVDELKSKVGEFPFKTKLSQSSEMESRGILTGEMIAKDGTATHFAVRLGEDPKSALLHSVLKHAPRNAIGRGTVDGISYAVSLDGAPKAFRKKYAMRTTLVESVCQVKNGKPCEWFTVEN